MAMSVEAVVDLIQQTPHVNVDDMVLYTKRSCVFVGPRLPVLLCSRSDITTLTLKCGLADQSSVHAILDILPNLPNLSCLRLTRDLASWGSTQLRTDFRFAHRLTSLAVEAILLSHLPTVKSLADAVRKTKTLTSLTCNNNDLRAKAARWLSEAMRENSTIAHLDLSNNALGDDGVSWLAGALNNKNNLESLRLQETCMLQQGMSKLLWYLPSCPNLYRLDISGNSIGDGCFGLMRRAMSMMHKLQYIYVARMQPGLFCGKDLQAILAQATNVHTFDGADNYYADTGDITAGVCANCSITNLNLSGNRFGAEGTKALLTSIAERSNCIASESVWNPNSVRNAGQRLLALNLMNNAMGSAGCMYVSQALMQGSPLTELDLSLNGIDDGTFERLLLAIATTSELRDLRLRSNPLTGAHFELLANTSLTALDVSDSRIGPTGLPNVVAGITGCNTLCEVHFQGCQRRSAQDPDLCKLLEPCIGVTYLDLAHNDLNDEFVEWLVRTLARNQMLKRI